METKHENSLLAHIFQIIGLNISETLKLMMKKRVQFYVGISDDDDHDEHQPQ